MPCYVFKKLKGREAIRGIRIVFRKVSKGFLGFPGASASSCKKCDYEKPQFSASEAGFPPLVLALLKLKKRKRCELDGLDDAVWEAGGPLECALLGRTSDTATWHLEFYASTFSRILYTSSSMRRKAGSDTHICMHLHHPNHTPTYPPIALSASLPHSLSPRRKTKTLINPNTVTDG